MTSINAWKPELVMPMPRPRRGPAIHAGQPPLRPGTYTEGADAAPALIMKTLATTPTSPAAPNAPATLANP